MAGRKKTASVTRTKAGKETRLALGRAREDGQARFPAAPAKVGLPGGYGSAFGEIRERIEATRLKAILDANATMIDLYWRIGGVILARQAAEGWGAKVIDRLSQDLRAAFPDMSGLSARNLKYMRAFAAAWPDAAIVQQALHKLPWGVNVEPPTSCGRCLPPIRTWPHRSSRIPTSSTSSARPTRAAKPRWNRHWSITYSSSCWSSARASRFWGDKCPSKWATQISR